MGKSTFKEKLSKNSSKSRSKKRRNKSRKSESKKLSRRDDSVSYSDESDSLDSRSVSSSSSSEGDHQRRRSRSRTRREGKTSKKKRPKRSYTSESSEDSTDFRERKRSKAKYDHDGKKRKRTKKKRKRDLSVGSVSSDSCSPCSGSNLDKSEHKRKRGKAEKRDRDGRTKGDMDKPRGYSSCSLGNESNDYQCEEFRSENTTKRLRSVITVVNDDYDDGDKEEMVCDGDDYPSCRSNDSNEKRNLEDEKAEAVVSNTGLQTDAGKGKPDEDGVYQTDPSVDQCGSGEVAKERNDQVSDADLESVLRKRALENLKKFRGGTRIDSQMALNQNDKSGKDLKIQSSSDAEQVKLNSSKIDDSAGSQNKLPAASTGSHNNKKVQEVVNDSGSTKRNIFTPQDQQAGKDKVNSAVFSYTTRPKLVRSVWRRDSSNASTMQGATSHESKEKLTSGGSADNNATEQTLMSENGGNSAKVNNINNPNLEQPSPLSKPVSEGESSKKPQDETKNSSQFEQKTMSVMRGGEMVQVSYKVYIPQKPPALARRQLKR